MGTNIIWMNGKLKEQFPEAQIIREYDIDIKYCELINGQTGFESEIVYIGKTSELSDNLIQHAPSSYILIEDESWQEYNFYHPEITLIILPDYVELSTLLRLLQELFFQYSKLQSDYEIKLLDIVAGGYGLKELMDTASDMLGNPLTIADINLKTLYFTKGSLAKDDPLWHEIIHNGYVCYETVSYYLYLNKEYGKKFENSTFPFIWKDYESRYERIIGRVTINHKTVATIGASNYRRPFRKNDLNIVNQLCKAVSAELQKDNYVDYTSNIMLDNFLKDLMDGNLRNPAVIDERMKQVGMSAKKIYFILTIDITKFDSSKLALSYLKDYLEKKVSDAKVSLIYNNIVMLLGTYKCSLPKIEETKMDSFFRTACLHGGLSRPFDSLTKTRNHYLQSLKALELSHHIPGNKCIYHYEDFVEHHMFELCAESVDLIDFCHPSVFDLERYDRNYNTCYLKSLYEYLTCALDLNKTASRQNIHRNSIKYRIEKIHEITNLDLKDSNTLFRLQLSFKILEFTGNEDIIKSFKS